jgi:excisionase family DNA binding protein
MEELFTPQEVAQKLKIDMSTVYRWIREGRLKAVKIGHFWRISESELSRLLKGDKENNRCRQPQSSFDRVSKGP